MQAGNDVAMVVVGGHPSLRLVASPDFAWLKSLLAVFARAKMDRPGLGEGTYCWSVRGRCLPG